MTIEVKPADDSLLQEFVDLSATEFNSGPTLDKEVVSWRHLENPVGVSVAVNFCRENRSVGRIWIQKREWLIGGRRCTLSSPIDFLIHPAHRNLPTFAQLFSRAQRESLTSSSGVIHTSNTNTDDLYRNFLKLKPVTELDCYVLPLRPVKLLCRKLKPRSHAMSLRLVGIRVMMWVLRRVPNSLRFGSQPSTEISQIVIQKFEKGKSVVGSRSTEIRAWRFRTAGEFNYRTQWFSIADECAGYIVTTLRVINGIRSVIVIDLVSSEKLSRSQTAHLWLHVAAEAASNNADGVFFFINRKCSELRNLARLPLLRTPRKFLPQAIPIFVRSGRDERDYWGLSREHVECGYFVLFDLDIL
jgi:hypothetical protein